jgi:putative FmdB family regulatory protein
MPLYEYQCEECGESFEILVRSAAQEDEVSCPKCGGTKVRKAISLFGVGGSGGKAAAGPSCSTGPT